MTTRRSARRSAPRDTREDVFLAAAELFSARGIDGVGVDDIARAARINKAMIYYHFEDKLALYREVVRDMLRAVGTLAGGFADRPEARRPAPRPPSSRLVQLAQDQTPVVSAAHAARDRRGRASARSRNDRAHEASSWTSTRFCRGAAPRRVPPDPSRPRLHVDRRSR